MKYVATIHRQTVALGEGIISSDLRMVTQSICAICVRKFSVIFGVMRTVLFKPLLESAAPSRIAKKRSSSVILLSSSFQPTIA